MSLFVYMDSNNSNQDPTQPVNTPQNDTQEDTAAQQDTPKEEPTTDIQNDSSSSQTDTPTQSDPLTDQTPAAPQADQTVSTDQQTPAADQTAPAQQTDQAATDDPAAAPGGNYIEDVGGDLIDLLDEIEADDNLIAAVATEMQLDKDRVKTILTGLLDKIDKEQVTEEEIALIMAAPVIDELPTEQAPTDQTPEPEPQQ